MAGVFQPVGTVADAVPMFIAKRIFSSSDYWLEHATAGHKCSGDYVEGIIGKFAVSMTK